jgi:hypothetical protein
MAGPGLREKENMSAYKRGGIPPENKRMDTAVNGVLLVVVFAVYYAGTEKMVEWVKNKHWRRPDILLFRLGFGSLLAKKSPPEAEKSE